MIYDGSLTYAVIGKEVCPETHRPHLQCYFEFGSRHRLNGVKKILGHQAWSCRPAREDETCNTKYCKKDNDFVVYGQAAPGGQGTRNDLIVLKRKLETQCTMKDLFDCDETFGSCMKYQRGISAYLVTHAVHRDPTTAPKVIISFGPPGCGKTLGAYQYAKSIDAVVYPPVAPNGGAQLWWDGYSPGSVALLDDFYGWTTWDFLLRLTDRFPLTVQTKNGSVPFNSPVIWITSNQAPEGWYQAKPGRMPMALWRRCTEIREYSSDGTYKDVLEDYVTKHPWAHEFIPKE